jgi:hypothetical protein
LNIQNNMKIFFLNFVLLCLLFIPVFSQTNISSDRYSRIIELKYALSLSRAQSIQIEAIIIESQAKIDSLLKTGFRKIIGHENTLEKINNESALKIEKILNMEQLSRFRELISQKKYEIENDPFFEFVLFDECNTEIDLSLSEDEILDLEIPEFRDERRIPEFEDFINGLKNSQTKERITSDERYSSFRPGIFSRRDFPRSGIINRRIGINTGYSLFPQPWPPDELPPNPITEMDRRLGLSDEQFKQVDTIIHNLHSMITNRTEEIPPSQDLLEDIILKTDEEIQKILNIEQKIKYLQMIMHRDNLIFRKPLQFE